MHVALTGNIGSGKSTVARLFADWGARVLDADAIVRDLQRSGRPVFTAIVAHFGPGVVGADGELDRWALRGRILADATARQALEQIVHPAVRAERQRLLSGGDSGPLGITVSEIPLLFEAADPAEFDAVVLVDAPEALRLLRLERERGFPRAEAEALIRMQQPAGPKRERADLVIDNEGTRETLRERAWTAWRKLISRARARA
jgi:dephospho-CoA kinase